MKVTIRVYAALRRYLPQLNAGAGQEIEVPDRTTVAQLIARLGVPDDTPLVSMVNGTVHHWDHVLAEGDTLHLFPPVVGG